MRTGKCMHTAFPIWNYKPLESRNCATQGVRALLKVTALPDAITLLLPKMFVCVPKPRHTFPRAFQSNLDSSPTFYLQIQDC